MKKQFQVLAITLLSLTAAGCQFAEQKKTAMIRQAGMAILRYALQVAPAGDQESIRSGETTEAVVSPVALESVPAAAWASNSVDAELTLSEINPRRTAVVINAAALASVPPDFHFESAHLQSFERLHFPDGAAFQRLSEDAKGVAQIEVTRFPSGEKKLRLLTVASSDLAREASLLCPNKKLQPAATPLPPSS